MNLKRKCLEVLVGTGIASVFTVPLFWVIFVLFSIYSRSFNWAGATLRDLVLALVGANLFGFIIAARFVVPSALLVSLVIALWLKRWSLRTAAVLLVVAAFCALVSSYIIDPTASKMADGSTGYFARFDWVANAFTLNAVISGFAASSIAFGAVLKCRTRCRTSSPAFTLPSPEKA
jgi:hypothetical protein